MANIIENRSSTTFTTAEEASIKATETAYSAVINPKMVTLTEEQLATMTSIDVDNYVFVGDTLTVSDADGIAMLPPAIGALVPEVDKDYTFYNQLEARKAWHLAQIEVLNQTQRLVAYESYNACNKIYDMYASLADAGVAGAQAKYDYLKARYKGNGGGRPPASND